MGESNENWKKREKMFLPCSCEISDQVLEERKKVVRKNYYSHFHFSVSTTFLFLNIKVRRRIVWKRF